MTRECNGECQAQLESARLIANSNHAIADAIAHAAATIEPAATFFGEASYRLTLLCTFLRRRGPWLLASLPLLLVSVGAVTPDAAKGLHSILVAFGMPR